ncbi:Asp23/Gls24 family envelope stress response protein [Streptomyces corynorhini]|uniref:Asp23/Gls24 family envelope stress response protein n=1 Tax=Streptomyces corynorhini TaxID=2282652 RepID=A0A370BIZ0_9ACTN|nr:Asp23/Gls24 family envelope stress response protein [Streptomyces corynorhini]RDG39355.1 Asp23/Gls24 family envelope stress response protein [Streptomyces corynorhini]
MAGDRVAAAERGATVIADRVVAKIAARAAREALDSVPEDGSPPHATVTVHHGSVRVRIGVELEYPVDIGARCGAVRGQVAHRVTTLAGLDVREVAVRVERLHSDSSRAADRGRIR